jgi:CRISPR/Cas system-associated exonuclease Cas4 (RecB family)
MEPIKERTDFRTPEIKNGEKAVQDHGNNNQELSDISFHDGKISNEIITHFLKFNKVTSQTNNKEETIYSVKELCGCLRQVYYERSGVLPDEVNKQPTVLESWISSRRMHLHNQLTYAYKWRELDINMSIFCDDIDESLTVSGRLDVYDWKTKTIIDFKTTKNLKWQIEKKYIPRKEDILQIQCYGKLFSNNIQVSNLTLKYIDEDIMDVFFECSIPLMNNLKWIKERITEIYTAVSITKTPPTPEVSSACKYCKYKKRCQNDDRIDVG